MIGTNQGRGLARSRFTGYSAALLVPIVTTLIVGRLGLPPFLFEHLIVLLVVIFAIPWGLGVATAGAIVAVLADNVLLRPPFGQPTVTGWRDVFDLALFVVVAVVVSGLVASARRERAKAAAAAERERAAREDRDRLIATVTHDLATPLAVLSGTLHFVRTSGPNAQMDLPRLLRRLQTATNRATSLVRTLADVEALDSDRFNLTLTRLDVREVLSATVEMLDRLSDRHPVVLTMPGEPVIVMGDAERLQRVIENVINNAIKYSPDGGAVEVSLEIRDGAALVEVRDHGMGISPAALPRIFERSYRAPEAAQIAPGLGLGLSISAEVASRHGGSLQARPGAGCGTVVSFRIPLSRVPAEESDAAAAG